MLFLFSSKFQIGRKLLLNCFLLIGRKEIFKVAQQISLFLHITVILFPESRIREEYFSLEAYNQRAVVGRFIPLKMKKQNEIKLQQQSAK